MHYVKVFSHCELKKKMQFTVLQFDTLWSRTGFCSCPYCQGNIRGAVFWPWPTRISSLHLTSLWKHELLQILRLRQSPFDGPTRCCHHLQDQYQSGHWPFRVNCVRICIKTNGWGLQMTPVLCLCAQTLSLSFPLYPTYPSQVSHSTPSGAIYHVMFKLMWDACLSIWPWIILVMKQQNYRSYIFACSEMDSDAVAKGYVLMKGKSWSRFRH